MQNKGTFSSQKSNVKCYKLITSQFVSALQWKMLSNGLFSAVQLCSAVWKKVQNGIKSSFTVLPEMPYKTLSLHLIFLSTASGCPYTEIQKVSWWRKPGGFQSTVLKMLGLLQDKGLDRLGNAVPGLEQVSFLFISHNRLMTLPPATFLNLLDGPALATLIIACGRVPDHMRGDGHWESELRTSLRKQALILGQSQPRKDKAVNSGFVPTAAEGHDLRHPATTDIANHDTAVNFASLGGGAKFLRRQHDTPCSVRSGPAWAWWQQLTLPQIQSFRWPHVSIKLYTERHTGQQMTLFQKERGNGKNDFFRHGNSCLGRNPAPPGFQTFLGIAEKIFVRASVAY